MASLLWLLKLMCWGIFLFTLFTFLMSYYENYNGEEKPDVHFHQWIIAFVYEFIITILNLPLLLLGLFDYTYLAYWQRWGERKETPVFLVHPYMMNRGCMIYLFIKLKMAGYRNVYPLTLRPKFAPIEFQAGKFAEYVTRIMKSHQRKFICIGHSQGGIILRYYAQKMGGAEHIKALITIGSPNKGTKLGVFARSFNAKQMHHNSEFIRGLNEEIPENFKMLCILSPIDNLVLPWVSGKVEGKESYITSPMGHMSLLFSPEVANKVISYLEGLED